MKRTRIALPLALLLALSLSAPAAAAPAAPAAVERLVVVLRDVEGTSIQIREREGAALSFSGPGDLYRYTVSGPKNGVTTVTITQKRDAENFSPYCLSVPLGAYSLIRAEITDSAASLLPQKADYEVVGEDSAFTAEVSASYAGKLSVDLEDSSVSVHLAGKAQNLTLTLNASDSAVSTPSGWDYRQGKPFTLKRGAGGTAIDLKFEDCAVSLSESDMSFESRYSDTEDATSISMSGGRELLLGDSRYGSASEGLKDAKAASRPNGLTGIKTVPASGITALRVNANLCGLVLESSKSGSFELAYQGVEDVKKLTVTAEIKDGTLTVTAEGTLKQGLYINTSPDWRVNCVRLLVPAGVLKSLAVDCGQGIVATDNLVLPAVTGGVWRGMAALNAGTLSAPVALSTKSGSLTVTADTVSAPVTLETVNGSAGLNAKNVTADVTVMTANGSVVAEVGKATGRLALTAKNGSVKAEVGSVKDAEFRADNGSVEVSMGTVTGDVACTVKNGSLDVELTRKPADLTFRLAGGWNENEWDGDRRDKDKRSTGLPSGWYDGLVLGSGKPTLTLSASTNGSLRFKAP